MNYYIQGCAAKADKIRAAFEKLGYDVTGFDMCNDNILFFTYKLQTGANVISTTNAHLYTANIIKTHPDYQELELHVQPKFKVGDEIIWNEPKGSKPTEPVKIIQLIDKDQLYMVDKQNGVGYVAYDMQDYYKLVQKPHYDISNFHAGMPVLVRDYDNSRWSYVQFSHYVGEECGFKFNACGIPYIQCIPFNDDTKHLLGTTDMCDEMYINW